MFLQLLSRLLLPSRVTKSNGFDTVATRDLAKTFTMRNLPAFYHECRYLTGYTTHSVIDSEYRSSVPLFTK